MMNGEVFNLKRSNKSKLEMLILLYAILVNDERIPEEVRQEYAQKYLEVVESGKKNSN